MALQTLLLKAHLVMDLGKQVAFTRETFMTRFLVGEKVIIRWGTREGKKAKIVRSLPSDGYEVKAEDGSIAFFSGKGLEREKEPIQPPV